MRTVARSSRRLDWRLGLALIGTYAVVQVLVVLSS